MLISYRSTCRVYKVARMQGSRLFRAFQKLDRLEVPVDASASTRPALDESSADAPSSSPAPAPVAASAPRSFKMFADESIMSFFRRLAFSPDGTLLAIPAGVNAPPGQGHCAYLYARGQFSQYDPIDILFGFTYFFSPSDLLQFCLFLIMRPW